MTPAEALGAMRALETAADSLMRLGDPGNAIALYALALRLRSEYLRDHREEAIT